MRRRVVGRQTHAHRSLHHITPGIDEHHVGDRHLEHVGGFLAERVQDRGDLPCLREARGFHHHAAARTVVVEYRGQLLKELPIKGLVGEHLPLECYLEQMKAEARAQYRGVRPIGRQLRLPVRRRAAALPPSESLAAMRSCDRVPPSGVRIGRLRLSCTWHLWLQVRWAATIGVLILGPSVRPRIRRARAAY